MKKVYYLIVTVVLGLNVIFPAMVYLWFGFFYVYYPVSTKYVGKATAFLVFMLILTICVVKLSRYGNKKIDIKKNDNYILVDNAVIILFWVSVTIRILKYIQTGGFLGIISGESNGTFLAYLSFFFDLRMLYFFVLLRFFRVENIKKIVFYSTVYVAISLMYSSRSGIFFVVLNCGILLFGLKISEKFRKKMIALLIISAIIAPFMFAIATASRGTTSIFSVEKLCRSIVGRLSIDEVAAIELEQYENGMYKDQLFEEKYGIVNQSKLIVNTLIPGSLFENDVDPNQYWRAIFSNWSEDTVKMYYTSIYSILPMYLYLKYHGLIGLFLYFLIIYFMFRSTCRMKNQTIALFFGVHFFYTVFQYFDWVYHTRDLVSFLLTLLMIKLLSQFSNRYRITIGSRQIL